MRVSVFIASTLSALGIGVAYNKIKQATGIELTALLWAAVITLIFGLIAGLYTNNRKDSKEEV